MQKNLKKIKAFTLAEMLITLIIIGIVLTIEIPLFKSTNISNDKHRAMFLNVKKAVAEIIAKTADRSLGSIMFCTELSSVFNTIGDSPNCSASTGDAVFTLSNGAMVYDINGDLDDSTTYPKTFAIDINGKTGPNNPKNISTYNESESIDRLFITVEENGEVKVGTNGTKANIDDALNEIITADIYFGGCATTIVNTLASAISNCTYTHPVDGSTACTDKNQAEITSLINSINTDNTTNPEPNKMFYNARYDQAQALRDVITANAGRAYLRIKRPRKIRLVE